MIPARSRQRGLTLIELMVSLALGLLILSAVLYVYLGARNTYRVSDNLARVQESGRFALEFLSQDLRMTSYSGCRSRNLAADKETLFNITANPVAIYTGSGDGIRGYENGAGWADPTSVPRAAGDVLTV